MIARLEGEADASRFEDAWARMIWERSVEESLGNEATVCEVIMRMCWNV
jgi:hypothetical protein